MIAVDVLLATYAEMRGGRWVPGPCRCCGKHRRIKRQVFRLEPWDRLTISPYRCLSCARRNR